MNTKTIYSTKAENYAEYRWDYAPSAIEPNLEMRQIATRELGSSLSVIVMDGSAENIKLPENSIDLITVAQSIHWFDPEPAKQDMLRILKKNGWLAICRPGYRPRESARFSGIQL